MKTSYLLGILLILATAFSNMAMAQVPQSMRAYEKMTPQSIKTVLSKRPAHMSRVNGLSPSMVQPLQMRTAQRGNKTIDDRSLRVLLERRAHPNASPAQSLAVAERNSFAAQPMMAQTRRNQPAHATMRSEQAKEAELEAIKAKMLSRLKRKP